MKTRSALLISALVASSVPLILGGHSALAASPRCDPPNRVLTPQDLPRGSSVVACHAVGRVLKRGALSVQIPPPGTRVVAEAIYPEGATMLAVAVDEDGQISYPDSEPVDEILPGSAGASSPSACSDSAYDDKDEEQAGTWGWYLGDGARPAGISTTTVTASLKQAVGWITTSYNDCGYADEVSASATYKGVSTYESDMTTSGGKTTCGDGSLDGRDGKSVVDFGNIDDNGSPPLAMECTWSIPAPFADNNIIESDIRFDVVDFDWTNAPGSGCSNSYDLRSVAVHEFGHSFGMGHVSEASHGWLTMSTNVSPCSTYQRTLGKGDVLSLRNTY